MKEQVIKMSSLLLLCYSQVSLSYGDFFSPGSSGMTFNLKTATSPAEYSHAGIRVIGKTHTLFCPMKVNEEGFCIIPISDIKPHNTMGFQGPQGLVNLEMCLNGEGQASCSPYRLQATPIRGINYDPAHSTAYQTAQTSNNAAGMATSMTTDFTQIKNNGFTVVKTFISAASTNSGVLTNLADIACPLGLKLMLGVYEFTPSDGCGNNATCISWTLPQINNAISSAQKYPTCIVGIAVGNEDIYDYTFTVPNTQIQTRISADISTIQTALGNAVPVGTAQQDGALLALAQPGNDPQGIIPKLNFVGANIYPYWSPTTTVAQAPTEFTNRLTAVQKAFPSTRVAVTEEGWPSSSNSPSQKATSISNEITYYTYWLGRATQDQFDSYYFSFYDKIQPNDGDADNYFGLCTYTNTAKSASLFACN
ncbi:MAG: hypothetical protein ACHP6H_02700 [Legionellales bacterium]